jgi:hypothetical protein
MPHRGHSRPVRHHVVAGRAAHWRCVIMSLPSAVGRRETLQLSDPLYVEEKLLEAVLALVGDGKIRDRLAHAAQYLCHLTIDEIPDKRRAKFADVKDTLTKYPAKSGEGSINTSIRRLQTNEEVAAVCRRILSIYSDICRDNVAGNT